MKKYIRNGLAWGVIGMAMAACSDWTEPEPKQIEHIGGFATMFNTESEEYYKELRAYKDQARNYGRPVAFGWFSNWSPSGIMRKGYLSAVPDSMDIISMWSGVPGRFQITEAQKRDKEFVQKVKGIKLLEVSLLSHLGKGRTPESVYEGLAEKAKEENWSDYQLAQAKKFARWDFWGFKSHDLNNQEELKTALSKFAKALCDSLVVNEMDGFDIDWEPGAGFNDADGTIDHDNIIFLVKEMGKYIGPKSDPKGKGHRLLCIDGEISRLGDLEEYVDYWIRQAYGHAYPYLNGPNGNNPHKVIVTENFESGWRHGGYLKEQASAMPEEGYKGGVGAYRFDNDYNNQPDYKYMREAIQINQQKFQEWKAKQTEKAGK
ncbi:glycoside hydrolase family 18 [Bacteroides pyogenes]|uniref:glycoside hydrolase family 18 n=1 Tax=Bacteroides pyogenes TaxID=310300 RepID=UPI0037369B73